MTAKYSALAGTFGFIGGVLFRDKCTSKQEVFALPLKKDDSNNHTAQAKQCKLPQPYTFIERKGFVTLYDHLKKGPRYTFEHITSRSIEPDENVNTLNRDFTEEYSLPTSFRSTLDDYKNSGYDKGHLASAANHKNSQKSYDETFVLSNAVPQIGQGFNQGAWNKVEAYVKKLVRGYGQGVSIITGVINRPTYVMIKGRKFAFNEVIGDNNVYVPSHCFKVLVGETDNKDLDLEAYLLPNKSITKPFKEYQVPKETIENEAGILMFNELPRSDFRKINGKTPVAETEVPNETQKKADVVLTLEEFINSIQPVPKTQNQKRPHGG